MPDTKITALTAISTVNPATYPLPIVDTADTTMAASGTTKKITVNQILGSGGTATLASATITGDLTVDTNVLKVDTLNNRVGIRTASPAEPLTVDNSSGVTTGAIRIYATDQSHSRLSIQNGNGQAYHLVAGNPGASNAGFALYDNTAAVTRWYVDNTGVHTFQNVGGVAGTAMTLNSTGLGVGGSPNFKLDVAGAANSAPITLLRLNNTGTTGGGPGIAARLQFNAGATALGFVQGCNFASGSIGVQISGDGTNIHQTIDTSGNVGIGVTPSAWNNNYNALDIGQNGTISGRVGTSNTVDIVSNGFRNSSGNWVYKLATSNTACRYQLDGSTGSHIWYSGVAGTAGNTIAGFSAGAMTLDASGNLLVGKTAASVTTIGFQTLANGEASVAMSSSTNAATTWNVYSTGAAAYRFYVGMGGTVYATNTTISAISDQRLKENVQDIDVGLGAILALKPRKFDWKTGKGKDIKGDRGFIAQEFEQVFPQLVDEWADPAPEGETPYKSVRQDLIPVLVKAIQELAAEVNALKNA